MTLMEDNFAIAALMDENAAVKIQSMIRLLEDNFDTRIKLKNPSEGGRGVDFDLINGHLDEVDECCTPKGIQRTGDRLEA